MNILAISPELTMSLLQNQNIKREIVETIKNNKNVEDIEPQKVSESSPVVNAS